MDMWLFVSDCFDVCRFGATGLANESLQVPPQLLSAPIRRGIHS